MGGDTTRDANPSAYNQHSTLCSIREALPDESSDVEATRIPQIIDHEGVQN